MITMTCARVVVNNSCKLDYARYKLIGKIHEEEREKRRGGVQYTGFMRGYIGATLATNNLTKLKPISRLRTFKPWI